MPSSTRPRPPRAPLSIREIPDRKAKATNYIEDEDEYYPGATRTSTRSRKQVSYEISSDEEEEPEDFVPTSASHRGRKAKSYAELSDSEIGLDTPPSSIASDRGDTPTLAISSVDDDEDDIPLHVLFSRRKTPQKYSEVTLISDSEDERIIIKTNVKSSRTQVDGVQAREWTPRETNIKVRGNRSHTFPNLTPSKTNGKASSNQLSIVQRGTPMVLQTNDDISYVEFIIARRSATAGKLFVSLATEVSTFSVWLLCFTSYICRFPGLSISICPHHTNFLYNFVLPSPTTFAPEQFPSHQDRHAIHFHVVILLTTLTPSHFISIPCFLCWMILTANVTC